MLQRRVSRLPLILLGAVAVGAAPVCGATWLETRAEIERLAEAGDFEAAAALGPELLEHARESYGEDSQELADSYRFLARIQIDGRTFLGAEEYLTAAIAVITDRDGAGSPTLLEPYIELGDFYFLIEDYEFALAAYENARAAGRRDFGLLGPGQIPILERLSRSAEGLDDYPLAKSYQETMFVVARRNYGPESIESIEAGYRYAAWLSERGDYPEARYHIMENQQVIDEHFDGDPRLTIERLRFSYEHVPRMAPGVVRPVELYEALELVEALDPPDPELHASLLLDLGDWNVRRGLTSALDRYREVWDLLGTFEGGEALREAWFADLVPVVPGSLDSRFVTDDSTAPEGFVTFGFNVDTAGVPREIRIVSADPPGLVDRDAIEYLASSRFRPQMIGGEFVKVDNQFTLRFRYRPEAVLD